MPCLNIDCGENPVSVCVDSAHEIPRKGTVNPKTLRTASDTLVAKAVHLSSASG